MRPSMIVAVFAVPLVTSTSPVPGIASAEWPPSAGASLSVTWPDCEIDGGNAVPPGDIEPMRDGIDAEDVPAAVGGLVGADDAVARRSR